MSGARLLGAGSVPYRLHAAASPQQNPPSVQLVVCVLRFRQLARMRTQDRGLTLLPVHQLSLQKVALIIQNSHDGSCCCQWSKHRHQGAVQHIRTRLLQLRVGAERTSDSQAHQAPFSDRHHFAQRHAQPEASTHIALNENATQGASLWFRRPCCAEFGSATLLVRVPVASHDHTSTGAGQMRRSTRRTDAVSGPAKRTRAATAGGASGSAQEVAALPNKRKRQQRSTRAPPEPESSDPLSSTVLDVPRGLDSAARAAGSDSDGGGNEDTSPDDGGDGDSSSSSDGDDTDVPELDQSHPVDDSSPAVTLDMVVWGTGLGRLQVYEHRLSWQSCSVRHVLACLHSEQGIALI